MLEKDYINETKEERMEFENIASNIFTPAYKEIVRQVKERTKINRGICVDVGSGGGHLGLAMADISDLDIYLFDISKEALLLAEEKILEKNLKGRVKTILGNVESIPLEDESIDLAISRGSVWFWENQLQGLKEIYRVLKPGGFGYIGGGFGNKEIAKLIDAKMLEANPDWGTKKMQLRGDSSSAKFKEILKEIAVSGYEIIDDERGLWAVFWK